MTGWRQMLGRQTLFRQTLLALIGALFFVHSVVALGIMLLSPRRAEPASITDVATLMARPGCPAASGLPRFKAGPRTGLQATLPAPGRGMTTDPYLADQLAAALDVPAGDVRIFWRRGSDIRFNRPAEVTIDGRRERLDQTIFLGGVVFAHRSGAQWCVQSISRPGTAADWRWTAFYLTLLSLAATLPLAWLFARRLSRPIREFANAADQIGRDSEAPPLAETGPDELRIASRALNEMQRGIQQQFRDREAMIAAIAHDLRTPLSRIAFRVEGLPPEVRDPVHRDIEQMKAMVKATIEFARGLDSEKGKAPVDLVALLRRLVEDELGLGAQIALTTDIGRAMVSGNQIEFARLFQNLIDNARKFAGAADIAITVYRDFAEVLVADRGPGIPGDRREEMFTPFVRGEPSRNSETGGVGLGLPIARSIARRYGGELTLDEREGGGLVAAVRLPLLI